MKKIFLIHHSHTDIGYTERQEKLMNYHKDFIFQAIKILDDIHSGVLENCEGFKWQCENQWQIENFYMYANKEQIEKFENYVKTGEIGLSGNYLNMTELVDENVLNSRTMKAKKYSEKIGIKIESGMSADINGYAWGYPDVLAKNGVNNLYCALHPHHGIFPLYKKQQPFYWQGPNGNKVLTWIGDHYHLGNEMFMCPMSGTSYTLFDDIRAEIENSGGIISKSEEETQEKEIKYAITRITRYMDSLEEENYPFDFIPLLVSGAITDNAPPNAKIAQRVNKLNELLADKVKIKMVTLNDFFDYVKENCKDIPTYSGDFADWWADGVGSTANTLKLYREAQRKLSLCQKIDSDNKLGDNNLKEQAEENMMLYAEHTWGYSSSISEPWDSLVACLEKKKDAYAINANTQISRNLDLILSKMGEVSIQANKAQNYKVINPHKEKFVGTAKLYIEYWEYLNGSSLCSSAKIKAIDADTGEEYPCFGRTISRAYEAEVYLELEAGEEKNIKLVQCFEKPYSIKNHAHIGAEGIKDIVVANQYSEMPFLVETDYFKIVFNQKDGISEIYDKSLKQSIIDKNSEHSAFAGVYEITPSENLSQCEVRRRMGRNRCALSTQRSVSQITNIEIVENGDVFTTVKLSYKLEGTKFYFVFLKVYKTMSKIEARVCLHKDSVWDPENVYVTLPFKLSDNEQTYIDKTGCIMRPGIDQLPGTCQNFYLLQNGIYKLDKDKSLIIAIKDAPLVAFGKREAAPIILCDGNNTQLNKATPYSWVMNNFWETNFKADLGGFYEFTYTISTGEIEKPTTALQTAKMINEGVLGFYI